LSLVEEGQRASLVLALSDKTEILEARELGDRLQELFARSPPPHVDEAEGPRSDFDVSSTWPLDSTRRCLSPLRRSSFRRANSGPTSAVSPRPA
jgi:hypothetical protein